MKGKDRNLLLARNTWSQLSHLSVTWWRAAFV